MPINVFGNSNSNDNGNKIDTSLFVQKLYLRTNYREANIKEDTDLRNQNRVRKLSELISIREAASKLFVDNNVIDPSIIKNTTHVDFKDRNLKKYHSNKINSFPTLGEQLTPKYYVDNAVNEPSLIKLDPNGNLKLDEQDSIVLNSTLTLPKTKIQLHTKSYVENKFNDPSILKNTVHNILI